VNDPLSEAREALRSIIKFYGGGRPLDRRALARLDALPAPMRQEQSGPFAAGWFYRDPPEHAPSSAPSDHETIDDAGRTP
jgi:hypothetical protein